MLKKLIVLVLMVVSQSSFAQEPDYSYIFEDGGYACLRENKRDALNSQFRLYNASYSPELMAREIKCETIDRLRFYLDSSAVLMTVSSIPLACTAIGAPVSIKLQLAAAGVTGISLLLGRLDCKSSTEEKLEELVKVRTCEVLLANGISCDPNKVPMKVLE